MFPVMEIMLTRESAYEDVGELIVCKKLVRVSNTDYSKVLSYARKIELRDFIINCGKIEDSNFDNEVASVALKYLPDNLDFTYFGTMDKGTIQLYYSDQYSKYTDFDECVDLTFSKPRFSDFPTGTISFFKIKAEDFEKAETVELELKKIYEI